MHCGICLVSQREVVMVCSWRIVGLTDDLVGCRLHSIAFIIVSTPGARRSQVPAEVLANQECSGTEER